MTPVEAFVCRTGELPSGARKLVKAGARNIAVYNVRNRYYAIDNACYHHGGPLLGGDIEDLGGHPCVICPWHSYKIALDTGEGFYMGVDAGPDGVTAPCLKSKGVKQRTHAVEVRDGDRLFVVVDVGGTKIESDAYAEMALANQEQAGKVMLGGGGNRGLHSGLPQRSGHLLSGRIPFSSAAPGAPAPTPSAVLPSLTVRCIKSIVVSGDERCKTFVFEKVEGRGLPRLEPGMYVTLALPLSSAADARENRTWTISSVRGELGGWFAITVKVLWPPEGRGGSAWLHQHAEDAVLPVVDFGGDFTVSKLRPPINNRKGAVLMLSAGIGVTPMFASVARAFSDPFTLASGPPLHVVHVHVDRAADCVPHLGQLAALHRAHGSKRVGIDPVSYQLHLFLTREAAGAVEGLPPPHATRPTGAVLQELLCSRFTPLGVIRDSADAEPAEGQEEKEKEKEERQRSVGGGGGGGVNINVLVMLCGPQGFMDSYRETLAAIGVDRNNIKCEAFDF